MTKTKIGILYGGRSVEHDISIRSAHNVYRYIDKNLFDVVLIGISKTGLWKQTETVEKNLDRGENLSLNLNTKNPCFIDHNGKKIQVDAIFPVLHGSHGEDGSVQGLLQTVGIPTIGSGILGSAISMSKWVSKQLMAQAQLPVTEFIHYRLRDKQRIQFDNAASVLGVPFMIKSANLGSSVGVSKVTQKTDFENALEHAFCYDHEILIEKYITGREIECAILGNTPPKASWPGEIIIAKNYAFYTFEAKYTDPNAAKIEVPAKLSPAEKNRAMELSLRAFEILQCNDFARIDLFISHEGKMYINEINTIPGFTDASMFPLMWQHHGISFQALITQLIHTALQRNRENAGININFSLTKKI